jgi:hypothetical protein
MKEYLKLEFSEGRNTTIFRYLSGESRDLMDSKRIKDNISRAKEESLEIDRAYWLGRLRGLADLRSKRVTMESAERSGPK